MTKQPKPTGGTPMKTLILNPRGQVIIATVLFLVIFLGLGIWFATSSAGDCIQGEALYEHKDYSQAMKFFQKAANKGSAYAEVYIGVEYEMGQGVSMDYPEAMKWYQRAVAHGFTGAQERIEILKRKMAGAPTSTPVTGVGK